MTQVVVSKFPVPLLEQIDAQAKRNGRSRAAEIRIMLQDRMSLRQQSKAA